MTSVPIKTGELSGSRDLYCMNCGYNLRGLSGDPKRCPECGCENSVADLLLPARLITRQLKLLETAPSLCFGMLLLIVLAALFFRADLIPFAVGLATIAVFGWLRGMFSFARSCYYKPGWGIALAAFHAYAMLMSAGIVGIIIASLRFVSSLMTIYVCVNNGRSLAVGIQQVVLSIVLGIVFVVAIRWLYRRLRSILQPLQRDVAVELARIELKRQRR